MQPALSPRQSRTHLLLLLATIFGAAAQRAVPEDMREHQRHIFHGEDATKGEFPFMVRLLSPISGETMCGGSLIKPNVVLTAAHCLVEVNRPVEKMRVVVGDQNSEEDEDSQEELAAIRTIIHPDYHDAEYASDIALLVLEKEVQLGNGVEVIALPTDRKLYEAGTPVTVIGWGVTESGDVSEILQKYEYEISDQKACSEFWDKKAMLRVYGLDWEGSLCTGKPPLKGWSFNGDSGGPVVNKDGDKFVLVGVVNWGAYTPDESSYDVNADVQFYKQWIDDNVEMALSDQGIELVGGDFYQGVVVFRDKTEIFTVCNSKAGEDVALAVCRNLGYTNGFLTSAAQYYYVGRKQEPKTFPAMARTTLECGAGADDVWEDCTMKKYPDEATVPCFTGQELAVQCYMAEWVFQVTNIDTRLKIKNTGLRGRVMCWAMALQNGLYIDTGSEVQMSLVNVDGTNVECVDEDMRYKRRSYTFMSRIKPQDGAKHNCFACVASIRGSNNKFFDAKVELEGCKMDESEALDAVNNWIKSNPFKPKPTN